MIRIFYKPPEMDLVLAALGYEDAPRKPAPKSAACVTVPFDPRPNLDPAKTVDPLRSGRFRVCDPTMQAAVVPMDRGAATAALAEAGLDNLAKDLRLSAKEIV